MTSGFELNRLTQVHGEGVPDGGGCVCLTVTKGRKITEPLPRTRRKAEDANDSDDDDDDEEIQIIEEIIGTGTKVIQSYSVKNIFQIYVFSKVYLLFKVLLNLGSAYSFLFGFDYYIYDSMHFRLVVKNTNTDSQSRSATGGPLQHKKGNGFLFSNS